MDLVGCIRTPGRIHHAFTGTGAINLACMAGIEGSVVHQCAIGAQDPDNYGKEVSVKLGHRGGVMTVQAECENIDGVYKVSRAGFVRTARMLMCGDAFI